MNRRKFIRASSKLGFAIGVTPSLKSIPEPKKYKSANEKIVLGIIGCNGMGAADMNNALKQSNVECAMIADVDESVRNRYGQLVTKTQGKTPILVHDFRKL